MNYVDAARLAMDLLTVGFEAMPVKNAGVDHDWHVMIHERPHTYSISKGPRQRDIDAIEES